MTVPYGPPDVLADFRDVPVQSLVCTSPLDPVPVPMVEMITATSMFLLAWLGVAICALYLSREWIRAHPATVINVKREMQAVFGMRG